MGHFDRLRLTKWNPQFQWLIEPKEVADKINSYHNDYPQRVESTLAVLINDDNNTLGILRNENLKRIHRVIFGEFSWAGQWRTVDVIVGDHRPPEYNSLYGWMELLESIYLYKSNLTLVDIKDWYSDFETLHPFMDGNGRVGGLVVAILSHKLNPTPGYLTVMQ